MYNVTEHFDQTMIPKYALHCTDNTHTNSCRYILLGGVGLDNNCSYLYVHMHKLHFVRNML